MSRLPDMNECPSGAARIAKAHCIRQGERRLSVPGEDLSVLELRFGDRNHLDRQGVELLILPPQHVVAIEGESIGVVFALIGDIGLVEFQAGLALQRL